MVLYLRQQPTALGCLVVQQNHLKWYNIDLSERVPIDQENSVSSEAIKIYERFLCVIHYTFDKRIKSEFLPAGNFEIFIPGILYYLFESHFYFINNNIFIYAGTMPAII